MLEMGVITLWGNREEDAQWAQKTKLGQGEGAKGVPTGTHINQTSKIRGKKRQRESPIQEGTNQSSLRGKNQKKKSE